MEVDIDNKWFKGIIKFISTFRSIIKYRYVNLYFLEQNHIHL